MAGKIDPVLFEVDEHVDFSLAEANCPLVDNHSKHTDNPIPALGTERSTTRPRLVRVKSNESFELPEEIPDSQESLDLTDAPDADEGCSFHTESTVILEEGNQIPSRPLPKYRLHQRGFNCNGRLAIESPLFAHHAEMEEEATQPSTQPFFDPRRIGRNNSGLTADDESDVICILHPSSTAALRAVAVVAKCSPQHILQNDDLESNMEEANDEQLLLDDDGATRDIALRMSSRVKDARMGFCFGRNATKCDFILGDQNDKRRVSNMHFRIYVNKDGIIMLHDMSTNGTVVDEVLLRGKSADPNQAKTRMLAQGSIIKLFTNEGEDEIKFIVRIPARDTDRGAYARKLSAFLATVAHAERGAPPETKAEGDFAALANVVVPHRQEHQETPNLNSTALLASGTCQYHHGMHWGGGEDYNVVGYIGKGAFAMVYKLATKRDGEVFAVKQLEKRKFMKNGILDHKVNNELKIIKHLRHPNIVQYIDYEDQPAYLYIIMEYVPCGELSNYMNQNGPMAEFLAKSVSRQILNALDYLHKRKITHRDIKPDNILVASNDPFTVKLSDFGLSKVVNDTETFLKTFCGTLLYCAPEVYPEYELYKSGLPVKKRRRANDPPPKTLPYNQSIDTWSFAAVLFHLISGKPPYTGTSEGRGAVMLECIMTTPLDIGPLKECGLSHNCINLITRMLNPDPLSRPDEQTCLSHAWLRDTASFGEIDLDENNIGFGANQENDEAALRASFETDSDDNHAAADSDMSEIVEVDEIDHADTRPSKRSRIDPAFALRDQVKAPSSGPEVLYPSLPAVTTQQSSVSQVAIPQHPTRLFGEIGASALRSSGVLGYDNQATLQFTSMGSRDQDTSLSSSAQNLRISTATDQRHETTDDLGQHQLQYPRTLPLPHTQVWPASSLSGVEALVGKFNMGSPESAKSAPSAPTTPRTPTTPKTREVTPSSALAGSKRSSQDVSTSDGQTPSKRRRESVQIGVIKTYDRPPSYYFERERRTHTLEYASEVSGRDYVGEAKAAFAALEAKRSGDEPIEIATVTPEGAKPWYTYEGWEKEPYIVTVFGGEVDSDRTDTLSVECRAAAKAKAAGMSKSKSTTKTRKDVGTTKNNEFIKPLPRLGKLTSVPGSFADLTLKIDRRVNTWGRAPENTIVYAQNFDRRVPKQAIDIMFWGPGMPQLIEQGGDWMSLENCWAVIITRSQKYVLVNGVKLKYLAPKHDAVQYGKLYTGDIVTVWDDEKNKEFLKFKCEFFHGKSAGPRPVDEQPFVIEKEKEKYMRLLRERSTSASVTASAPAATSASASTSQKA